MAKFLPSGILPPVHLADRKLCTKPRGGEETGQQKNKEVNSAQVLVSPLLQTAENIVLTKSHIRKGKYQPANTTGES